MKAHKLFLATGILAIATPGHAAVLLTDGLVGYFDFEGSSISNEADTVGSNHGGTFENGTNSLPAASTGAFGATSGNSGGRFGNGIRFTTTTGTSALGVSIPIGFGGGQDLGGTFTISVWAQLDAAATTSTNTSGRFFVYEGGEIAANGNYDASLSIRDSADTGTVVNNYQVFVQGSSGGNLGEGTDTQTTVAPGTWANIITTYVPSGANTLVSTYINGVLQDLNGATAGSSITVASSAISSNGFLLGRARDNVDDRAFSGMIDEFAVWNRALNADEISAISGTNGYSAGAIPEPSIALLGGLGLLSLLRRRSR